VALRLLVQGARLGGGAGHPLTELKIAPREGAVFAGNVGRSRAVEQPDNIARRGRR